MSDQDEPLRNQNGRFTLRRDIMSGGVAAAKAAFRDHYIARGRERPQAHGLLCPKAGVGRLAVDVRELGNRWASCSRQRARLPLEVHDGPQTIIDYIVVHELCHFHHRDHTDAFWNGRQVMPVP